MSTNTQAQGRTFFSERDFTYTPLSTDDSIRALYRWEMELQRQLYLGDVTRDPVAKQAAMLVVPPVVIPPVIPPVIP